MVRTRVGYAGGKHKDPTYHDLGDHTETIEIDFDPGKTSYEKLLAVFWAAHNPCGRAHSRQYMSAIFYRNAEQKKLALETRDRLETQTKGKIATEIAPLTEFYVAEDYHQKYRLRSERGLMDEFRAMYPRDADFVNSTAAARVNSYLDGHGTFAALQMEIGS